MEVQELLTMKQVCEILKVTDETVKKEITEGRLAGTLIRRHWKFTPQAIENYIKSRTTKVKKVPA